MRFNVLQGESHHRYNGRRRWITVTIHPDFAHMRAAGARRSGESSLSLATAGALFQPAPMRQRCIGGVWVDSAPTGNVGLMRLVSGHITTEVVAHECVHAALAIYRRDIHNPVTIGDLGDDDTEECLAYIVGDLIRGLTNQLHDHDAWTVAPPTTP